MWSAARRRVSGGPAGSRHDRRTALLGPRHRSPAAVMALPDPATWSPILDVGAYGHTESMPFFLSHPLPPEIAIRGGTAWVARPRVEPDLWLGWQEGEPPAG